MTKNLTEFLHWFRVQTEGYWRDIETETLADFKRRGAGGASWKRGTKWTDGLSGVVIDELEDIWGIKYPEEYRAFLSILHCPDRKCLRFGYDSESPHELRQLQDRALIYNWLNDRDALRLALDWPLEGILLDVENNNLWFESWGERPVSSEDRKKVLEKLVAQAPTLIPIFGHRYLLNYPLSTGRPVLSVYQSDIVVYGSNIQNYLIEEFGKILDLSELSMTSSEFEQSDLSEIELVPFWGEMVE